MGSLASFLPPHLVALLARTKGEPAPPHVTLLRAALLFSDIAGFTALTEALQVRGREGAEEITDIIRAAFRPAIESIVRFGGSIVSFGGDAAFVVFPGESPVRRALAAAEAIRDHFRDHGEVMTSVGAARLGISQAIHYGTVRAVNLGRPDRRIHLVCGAPVCALARLEAKATAGKTLVSRAARAQARVEDLPRCGEPAAAEPPESVIETFVAPHVRELQGRTEGEYRHAVMMFFETRGWRVRALQAFVLKLLEVLDDLGGILVSPDLSVEGTKWLCAFGAPRAHEDDPQRAARAALRLMHDLPRGLQVRAGMHTGTVANVLMGAECRRSYELMGDVTNTAARAAAKASWGEVVVTDATLDRLPGIETSARGTHAAKGKAAPLKLHALVSAGAGVREIRISAPMVGRAAELEEIKRRLEGARQGQGSTIALGGLPGIGKSRLAWEAARAGRDLGFVVHEGRAFSFGAMRYGAIGELLRHALGIVEGSDRNQILASVDAESARLGLRLVDRYHLADVLGERPDSSPIVHLEPSDVRINNTIAIKTYLLALARHDGPQLLVLEDMHWSDEMTREAVEWLAQELPAASIVMLLSHRPGYEPPVHALRIGLGELPECDIAAMLHALLWDVPTTVARLVTDKAAGNPFYVEELVRHLLESGILGISDAGYELTRDPGPEDLPDTLELAIEARLDRLAPDVRRVAQLGAVIGRSFLLEILSHLERQAARLAVADLTRRELVIERSREPHTEYVWRQALTRDVAYAGILVARRRKLHAAVATAIEVVLAAERERFLAALGDHWDRAGDRQRAATCYLAAARQASQAFAHEEAERLYRSYLRLVDGPSAESIAARNELGEKVLRLRGRMAEAEGEHRHAADEARSIGDRHAEGASLRATGAVCRDTGRMDEARGLFEQALAIAHDVGDRGSQGIALGDLANLLQRQGGTDEPRGLYDQALAIAREVGDRSREGIVLGNLATLLGEMRELEDARGLFEQALAIHRGVGDRANEGKVLVSLAILYKEQGRMDDARDLYGQGLNIHREVGDRRSEGRALANLANLDREQGRMEDAATVYEQGLAILLEVGDRQNAGRTLSSLANLHRTLGRAGEAQAQYEQALAIHRELGDRRFEGIVLSNMAGLLHEEGRRDEACAVYEQAICIHREVGDRRVEGMVTLNLASLKADQGRMEEARALYEEALVLHREIGERRFEGIAHGRVANWELVVGGNPALASEHALTGEALLSEPGDEDELVTLVCTRGHVALSTRQDASELLGRARSLQEELAGTPGSELARTVEMLDRASAAERRGHPLVRGYCAEDLKRGELRWLREHRPEAIPPAVMARISEDGTMRTDDFTDGGE